MSGLTLLAKKLAPPNIENPVQALANALGFAVRSGFGANSFTMSEDPKLPDGVILIVIGPKMVWWPKN